MTTMVLTMPRQMKGTSYVLLIAFLACFLPLGQFATVIADDDRGAWDFVVDVGKVIVGVKAAVEGLNLIGAGVTTIATTGWSGVGTAAGGGAIALGAGMVAVGMGLATDGGNNIANDIADLFD